MKQFLPALLLALALSGIAPGTAVATAQRSPSTTVHSSTPLAATSALKREVFGFALASSLSDATFGYPTWNFSLLSTVAFFGLHVNDNGTLANDSSMTVWNSPQRPAFVNAAHSKGTKVVVTIVLQDFSPSTPHMCLGLANYSATVGYIVSQVKASGVDGVNIDYEGLNGSCNNGDSSWARRAFTFFIAALRAALPAGSYLSVDTYASSASDPLGFFDVQGLNASVDSFFVMAYDLEYSNYRYAPIYCSTFCLSPTAPLSGYKYNATDTASQYIAAVPASKVILGVPYYGRKSCVAGTMSNQFPTGPVTADTYLDASTESIDPAVRPGSYVTNRDAFDPLGQEPWDTWFNTSMNCTRQMYWDDVTSLGKKYDLVNKDNLRGVGIWTLNYGGGAPELWSSLSSHFATGASAPANLSACAGASSATVSWSPNTDASVTTFQVTANPGGATVTVPAGATLATISGLTPGTAYTLSVQGVNSSGPGLAGTTASVTPAAALAYTGYFPWYDLASPGMVAANIDVLNTGAAPSSGCVVLSGQQVVPFSLNAGQESKSSFRKGSIGGPVIVTVNSGPPVQAWQRVQYYQSLSETWARPASAAATTGYFAWYDLASEGMRAETFHITNVSGAAATGTIALPGAASIAFNVANGENKYFTFPYGTIGGPVTITSNQPVLATLRAWYYQSLSEMPALHQANAGTVLYLPWYDLASPGMRAETIHIANIGASTATGTIALPRAGSINFSVLAGRDAYYAFPGGTIGGPVTITSNQPVLATMRAWYFQSLNEVWARTAGASGLTLYYAWYDLASPGMYADTVHITNVSGTAASGSITLPGASPIQFNIPNGQDAYFAFPGGSIGGPITISSSSPVLASLRSWYYQSLNEVPAD